MTTTKAATEVDSPVPYPRSLSGTSVSGASPTTAMLHSVSISYTSTTSDFWKASPWVSGCVLAVLVLGAMCLVLGSIYAYIYFTRINPRAANRAARVVGRQLPPADDGNQPTSTHMFLQFKKS